MPSEPIPQISVPSYRGFPTTHWSVVRRVGATGEDSARAAMAELCNAYWFPLYAFVRRRGISPHDAQDLTQGFFHEVIDGDLIERAREEKGRFRSFLLGALQNYLANQHRREQAVKRGGRYTTIPLDEVQAEERFALEPVDHLSPEAQFERSWAFALLERVGVRLGEDYAAAGRVELFTKLQPYLAGKAQRAGYAELGKELSMSESAVAVAVHRMRRRYGELLREEIAHTVASPEEVDDEIAYLLGIVARV